MKSFFGAIWRDIQIGVRLLTPFEGALSAVPGGSIVVTVLNILTLLNKIIPGSSDATKANLAAALALPNHPTADPVKLEAAINKLLAAASPIGVAGIHAIATVEQLAPGAPGETKKKTAMLLIGEIAQVPTASSAGVDATVAALNEIGALV